MSNDRIYYSHEAEMYAKRDRGVLAMLFLTFGVGIGALIALLYAPSSGKVTRHQIADKVEDGLKTGRDAVEPMVKRVEEKLQDGRDAVEPMVKRVEEKLQDGRDAVEPMVKRVEEEFVDLKKNIKDQLKQA